jgi:hypothetical protein
MFNQTAISRTCRLCVAAALTAGLLLALQGATRAGTIAFFEGDFLTAPAQTFVSGTGESTATTPLSGGNPGSYRDISLALDVDESRLHFELVDGFVFDPSAQGAATSVSVSYDVRRTFTSTPLATQVAQFIAVEQDGVVRNFFGGVTTSTTFVDFSVADIVPLFADVNWIDGSAIRFGFGMSAFAGGGIPFTLAGGYDNFEVTVNFESISEPVPLAVFAFSAIWFFARRRKAV